MTELYDGALSYLKEKRLSPSFHHLDTFTKEHASAFTVAKVMEEDLLEDIKEELEQALKEGATLRQFQKRITPRCKLRAGGAKRL